MNARIKELAEQALREQTVQGFAYEAYRPAGWLASISKGFTDKFAELLIAKCIDLCKQVSGSDSFIEVNSPEDGAKSARMNIENYFKDKQ